MDVPKLIATFFGAGQLNPAPGTWGSVVTLPLVWLLIQVGGGNTLYTVGFLALGTAIAAGIGWWSTARYLEQTGKHDPSEVVIDEVAGQLMTFLVAAPFMHLNSLDVFVAGFFLFRFFDITKIWPANWADSQLEGATGVMLDDLFAGVYAGLILILINWLM